jgi:hypothetical protein
MFIRVTLKNNTKDEAYINIAHIEGFRQYGQHSKIWLSGGDVIPVDESLSKIMNQIEEAKHEKADY